MDNITQELLRGIYNPPRLVISTGSFESVVRGSSPFYVPYGRSAIYLALKSYGIGRGDHVLLPSLICRDVLSAITTLGAQPVFYEVDKQLMLNEMPQHLPPAKACIFVNYFGFSQSIDVFEEYCRLHGALLIEDNAHGLFSADINGQFLGTRAPMGIFSFRKTLPVLNGAALVVNDAALLQSVSSEAIPRPDFSLDSTFFDIKCGLRSWVDWMGPSLITFITPVLRCLRQTGIKKDDVDDAEYCLPSDNRIYRHLQEVLGRTDIVAEIERRRALYLWLADNLSSFPIQSIFPSLPAHTAPFVYPFYAEAKDIGPIRKFLRRHYLECFPWPDLPKLVIDHAPSHYKQIWAVRFLW